MWTGACTGPQKGGGATGEGQILLMTPSPSPSQKPSPLPLPLRVDPSTFQRNNPPKVGFGTGDLRALASGFLHIVILRTSLRQKSNMGFGGKCKNWGLIGSVFKVNRLLRCDSFGRRSRSAHPSQGLMSPRPTRQRGARITPTCRKCQWVSSLSECALP